MPVLMRSENTSQRPGFSWKERMRPSESVTTMPYSWGEPHFFNTIVTGPPWAWWKRSAAARSKSVAPSPESTMKRSFRKFCACFTLPAVPRGAGST